MNYRIRRAIERYIQVHGQQDTRDVIALFANLSRINVIGLLWCHNGIPSLWTRNNDP